jgi:hypothetical protein
MMFTHSPQIFIRWQTMLHLKAVKATVRPAGVWFLQRKVT